VVVALIFGGIGFVDDYLKISKKSADGLSAKQKYLTQSFSAIAIALVVSPGTLVSSSNKTDHHNITEILLKVVLKHHNPNPLSSSPPDIKTLDIKNLCRT
jgi:UDP-N-acetylmuramyl pentapeptide phosphotransferase/UDP-N-acetylglucosamine-1-phosphate transferase